MSTIAVLADWATWLIQRTAINSNFANLNADKAETNAWLSQFSATTSAQLASVMTDETWTGSLVFATSPTLVTPKADNFIQGFRTQATAAGTTTLVVGDTYTQVFTGTTTQTCLLPTTSVVAGQQYNIINNSTWLVTVQSSGANTIIIMGAQTTAIFTALVATPTTAANWDYSYEWTNVASGKVATINNTLTLAGTDGTTMTFPSTSATIARTDAANTFTGVQTMTSPATTTSITTASTSFTAWAWATTLLTIGGTGASASLFAPSTLDTTSSTTGAIRTSGWISAAKALNIGTSATIGTTIELWHATDTTLSRVSAWLVAVEGTTLWYLEIPQQSKSVDYTAVLADSGKSIDHPSTDANARTFTIPANASVAYHIGTCISFSNMTANVVTIAITTDTMYLAGAWTTGSRSLAQYGTATARKLTSTTWLISWINLT